MRPPKPITKQPATSAAARAPKALHGPHCGFASGPPVQPAKHLSTKAAARAKRSSGPEPKPKRVASVLTVAAPEVRPEGPGRQAVAASEALGVAIIAALTKALLVVSPNTQGSATVPSRPVPQPIRRSAGHKRHAPHPADDAATPQTSLVSSDSDSSTASSARPINKQKVRRTRGKRRKKARTHDHFATTPSPSASSPSTDASDADISFGTFPYLADSERDPEREALAQPESPAARRSAGATDAAINFGSSPVLGHPADSERDREPLAFTPPEQSPAQRCEPATPGADGQRPINVSNRPINASNRYECLYQEDDEQQGTSPQDGDASGGLSAEHKWQLERSPLQQTGLLGTSAAHKAL